VGTTAATATLGELKMAGTNPISSAIQKTFTTLQTSKKYFVKLRTKFTGFIGGQNYTVQAFKGTTAIGNCNRYCTHNCLHYKFGSAQYGCYFFLPQAPLMMQFLWMSPYCTFDNNPVFLTDIYGLSTDNHDGEEGGGFGQDEDGPGMMDDGRSGKRFDIQGNKEVGSSDQPPKVVKNKSSWNINIGENMMVNRPRRPLPASGPMVGRSFGPGAKAAYTTIRYFDEGSEGNHGIGVTRMLNPWIDNGVWSKNFGIGAEYYKQKITIPEGDQIWTPEAPGAAIVKGIARISYQPNNHFIINAQAGLGTGLAIMQARIYNYWKPGDPENPNKIRKDGTQSPTLFNGYKAHGITMAINARIDFQFYWGSIYFISSLTGYHYGAIKTRAGHYGIGNYAIFGNIMGMAINIPD
jgi:hypothetical protein